MNEKEITPTPQEAQESNYENSVDKLPPITEEMVAKNSLRVGSEKSLPPLTEASVAENSARVNFADPNRERPEDIPADSIPELEPLEEVATGGGDASEYHMPPNARQMVENKYSN